MTEKKHLHVLVTDDIYENREAVKACLLSIDNNIAITEATHGEEAVDRVREQLQNTKHNFDVIIMDYQMPYMNGQAATDAIRALEAKEQLPEKSTIITWSASKSKPYLGADDIMPKPLLCDELKDVLLRQGVLL